MSLQDASAMASSPKPKGPLGIYQNCDRHITEAGLSVKEAADLAGISVSSISRMKNGATVLLTTLHKLINALNKKHYVPVGSPLNKDAEIKLVSTKT